MQLQLIQQKIHTIRNRKVMLDFDLAALYDVENRVLKQAVRRNISRFPEDFMFELTLEEYQSLRSQNVTLKTGRGQHSKYLPFALTEHGVTMLASVLNSEKAVQVNIAIVRAFIALREFTLTYQELADQMARLETKYDRKFTDVYEVLRLLLEDRETRTDWQERERIGFKK